MTSFSLRDQIRARPSRTSTSTRIPSHFTSWTHSAPEGTWSPLVASIGSTGSSWQDVVRRTTKSNRTTAG